MNERMKFPPQKHIKTALTEAIKFHIWYRQRRIASVSIIQLSIQEMKMDLLNEKRNEIGAI